jgi:two-component system sensor histidine kinase UhpB
LELSRLLLRRLAGITLASLVLALALTALWTHLDIGREGQGAVASARLMAAGARLRQARADEIPAILAELQRLHANHSLRHLDFELRDGAGRVLIPYHQPGQEVGRGATRITLQRDDGRLFEIRLLPNPETEQAEARERSWGMTGLLLLQGLAMLLGVLWVLRRALGPLDGILATVARYRAQDFSPRVPALPVRELDQVGAALNDLADGLVEARARQQQLHLRLVSVQEDERARLTLALQEHLAQDLAGLRVATRCLLRQTREDARLHPLVEELETHAGQLQQGVRDLLGTLHAPVDDGETRIPLAGLLHEMQDLWAHSWQHTSGSAPELHIDLAPDLAELPRELGLTVHRMVQEALTNIHRHAHARRVCIAIRPQPDGLECLIQDDGGGLADPASAFVLGHGLAALRERIWAQGGRLNLEAGLPGGPGPGLGLRALLPQGSALHG